MAGTNIPDSQKESRCTSWSTCLYKELKHGGPFLSVLKMVGTLPKSKFPNASQEPTLQTGLFEDGSLRPAVLNLFCTPVHSWMAEISAQHKQLQTGHKEATYLGNSAKRLDPSLVPKALTHRQSITNQPQDTYKLWKHCSHFALFHSTVYHDDILCQIQRYI